MNDEGLVLDAGLGPRDAALDAEAGAADVLGVELGVGLAQNYGIVPDGVPPPSPGGGPASRQRAEAKRQEHERGRLGHDLSEHLDLD